MRAATVFVVAAARDFRPRALREGSEPDPRFTLANERTFLAWIRTSLGLTAAAVALEAFATDVFDPRVRAIVACILLVFAALFSLVALARWLGVERAMRARRPLPVPWASYVLAVLLAVTGVALAVAIAV